MDILYIGQLILCVEVGWCLRTLFIRKPKPILTNKTKYTAQVIRPIGDNDHIVLYEQTLDAINIDEVRQVVSSKFLKNRPKEFDSSNLYVSILPFQDIPTTSKREE